MKFRLSFALSAALFTASAVQGEDDSPVKFESKIVHLNIQPDAESAPLEWVYTNQSNELLVVDKFDQSCGCLTGNLETESVAPGKSGTIRASFTPGPYRGVVRKSLHVRFVGHDQAHELVAEVTIPSSVELSTRDLKWNPNSTESQVLEVSAGTKADIQITGLVGVSDELFTIQKEAVEDGRHYRVSITPKPGISEGTHTLQVRTDSKDPRDQVMAVFLQIKDQPTSAKSPVAPQPKGS